MVFWKKKEPEDYIAKKEYKKAIDIYRQRLAKQPTNTALRLNLADALLADRQTEQALHEYKDIAVAFSGQGFIVKAIAMYKKMLKIKPDLREIESLLANLSGEATVDTPASQKSEMPEKSAVVQLEIENKLLKDLTKEEFQRIVEKLLLRHFDEDTIVVKEGDPGDSMFIVVRGEVRVLTRDIDDKEVSLANLGEGEFFGEVSLLTGKPRTATIITNTNSELLELTKKDYENIVSKHPHVRQVVEEFHLQRAYRTIDAMIQAFHDSQRQQQSKNPEP